MKKVIFMQKTIKFSDFMAKKHQILGLTEVEEQFSETASLMLTIASIAFLIYLSVSGLGFGAVADAFLRL
jgi:hypothetical protein